MNICLENHQSPGDVLILTAVIRTFKEQYPDFKIWAHSSANSFLLNNPLIENYKIRPQVYDTISSQAEEVKTLKVGYGDDDGKIDNPWSLHKVHDHRKHFLWGMLGFINCKLGLDLKATSLHPDLYLTEEEKQPLPDLPKKYWVVNCGIGPYFSAKKWNPDNWAALFQMFPELTFVQMGGKESNHDHPQLGFPNVIPYVGKTTLRSSLSLLYNAQGLISSVTYAMHAWAALHYETKRPFITIAGGREQWWWETYPQPEYTHWYLHSMGSFPCCLPNRACWKSECDNKAENGYPKCLELITPETVGNIVRQYV